MKIVKSTVERKTKLRTLIVELQEGERLIAVRDNQFYRLGEPLNDVVQGHIIAECVPAVWCSVEQKMVY